MGDIVSEHQQDRTPSELVAKPAERLKAFELYIRAAADGKRRSFRSISMELGVHETTIARWYKTDDWASKVRRMLDTSTNTQETVSQHIKRLIRNGLIDGLTELGRLTCEAEKDQDRISATKTMAEIAQKMDAISSAAGGLDAARSKDLEFKDDLPDKAALKEDEWPANTATSDKTPDDGKLIPDSETSSAPQT